MITCLQICLPSGQRVIRRGARAGPDSPPQLDHSPKTLHLSTLPQSMLFLPPLIQLRESIAVKMSQAWTFSVAQPPPPPHPRMENVHSFALQWTTSLSLTVFSHFFYDPFP